MLLKSELPVGLETRGSCRRAQRQHEIAVFIASSNRRAFANQWPARRTRCGARAAFFDFATIVR